jgi:hypothetical protein
MLAGEVTEATTGFNQFFLLPFGCEQCPTSAPGMDRHLVSILVTNFRVVITHIKHKSRMPITIPLMTMDSCRCGKNGDTLWLDIFTKHVWCFRIAVSRDPKLILLMQKTLERMMPRTLSQLFCFDHFAALQSQARRAVEGLDCTGIAPVPPSIAETGGALDSAWGVFSLERALRRMVGPSSNCCSTSHLDLSTSFGIFPLRKTSAFATYPYHVILPSRATEELVERAANFRHHGRIPSVSWIHGVHGGVIARSAQPKTTSATYAQDDQALCSLLNAPIGSQAGGAAGRGATTSSYPPARSFFGDPTSPAGTSKPSSPPSLVGSQIPSAPTAWPRSAGDSPGGSRSATPPPLVVSPATTAKPPSIVDDGFERENSMNAADFASTGSYDAACKRAFDGRRLIFVDCRSRAAAVANFAKGGGTELPHFYDRSETIFMQLDNIHAVRAAFERLSRLSAKLQTPALGCPVFSSSSQSGFWSRLEATEWPVMTQKLLWAAWRVSELVHNGDSVLVHCSDGWDRTSQVVSLSMILLDAHYRTIEGFCELVVREWLQMGHRFADRCFHERLGDEVVPQFERFDDADGPAGGHPSAAQHDWTGGVLPTAGSGEGGTVGGLSGVPMTSTPRSQVSPVFVQFMDAVYQLLRMYPAKFEFTPKFLLHLTDQVYNCRFGTFLFNSHRTRSRRTGVVGRTASVWGDLEQLLMAEKAAGADLRAISAAERLINPFYVPYRNVSQLAGSSAVSSSSSASTFAAGHVPEHLRDRLVPSFQSHRYQFWTSCYGRYVCEDMPDAVGVEADNLSPMIDGFLSQVFVARGTLQPLVVMSFPATSSTLEEMLPDHSSCKRLLFLDREDISPVVATEAGLLAASANEVVLDESDDDDNVVIGIGAPGESAAASPASPLSQMISFVPRSDASRCELCGAEFTFFFRRHTCRRCCRAACTNCASQFIHLPRHAIQLYEDRLAVGPVRVCLHCHGLYSVPGSTAAQPGGSTQ